MSGPSQSMFERRPTPTRGDVPGVDQTPAPRPVDPSDEASGGGALLAAFRLVLALAALAAFFIDPQFQGLRGGDTGVVSHGQLVLALCLYLAFSLALCVRGVRAWLASRGAADLWLDLAFATVLVTITGGLSSIYFPLLLFAMVVASFRPGTPSGALLFGSVLAFLLVAALTFVRGTEIRTGRAFMRLLVLVTLGLLLLKWGRLESRNRARLGFLREIVSLANPRLGIDHLVDRLLARLLRFYPARAIRLVVRDLRSGDAWMRTADLASTGGRFASTPLDEGMAGLLLANSGAPAFVRRGHSGLMRLYDLGQGRGRGDRAVDGRVLALQEAGAYLSAPFAYRDETEARIFIATDSPWSFDRSDPAFVTQVLTNVQPILQNVRLLDRLTLESVGHERLRLANDLHDGVIQPLIGIRLGLSAALGSLGQQHVDEARQQIQKLIDITETEIASVRSFAGGLRAAAKEGEASDPLVRALEAYCEGFSSRTGIRVQLDAGLAGGLGRRASTEILNMVAEGLSNVRRHSGAHFAKIRLRSDDRLLTIHIENEIPGAPPSPFRPRTLEERATALGGHVSVSTAPTRTSVAIELPL